MKSGPPPFVIPLGFRYATTMPRSGYAWFAGRCRSVRLHGGSTTPWRFVVDFHVRYSFHYDSDGGFTNWTPSERHTWKWRFERQVQRVWSRRWMLNPTTVEQSGFCEATGLGCRDPARPTEVVLAVRNARQSRWRPRNRRVYICPVHIYRQAPGTVQTRWSPERGLECQGSDTTLTPSSDRRMQIAVCHEVGHALGLRHPGEVERRALPGRSADEGVSALECPPGGSHPESCYYDGAGDSGSIMGSGMYVRRDDYVPFEDMLNDFYPGYGFERATTRHGTYARNPGPEPGLDQCQPAGSSEPGPCPDSGPRT